MTPPFLSTPATEKPELSREAHRPAQAANPTHSLCDLSIIIPAYNEDQRLPGTLRRIQEYLKQYPGSCEIIVVDDGSRDSTLAATRALQTADNRIRILQNPGNQGKGYSVRHGMLLARGRWLLFSDADLAAPIEELEKLSAALDQGADIAIGSRSRRELIRTHQSGFREWAGRIFNRLVILVLGLRFRDTQCGFKLFRREAALALFPYQRIRGWGFDPELLFLARQRHFQTIEVPVVWAHVPGAKIRMLRDSMRMFGDILTIRMNHLCGRYAKPAWQAEPSPADQIRPASA